MPHTPPCGRVAPEMPKMAPGMPFLALGMPKMARVFLLEKLVLGTMRCVSEVRRYIVVILQLL